MYFELVYNSIANENFDESVVLSLQHSSKNFNNEKNITGCLIYYNLKFVGILEGEEEEVRKLFCRIKDDPKHSKVELLASEFANQRHFEHWNMVFQIKSSKEKIGMTERLFKDNMIGLTWLSEKPTYTSKVFWQEFRNVLDSE
tara:strand:- start:2182 stop:2610 length:429 start_codon:yes stop_codon:yes gene_type:complete